MHTLHQRQTWTIRYLLRPWQTSPAENAPMYQRDPIFSAPQRRQLRDKTGLNLCFWKPSPSALPEWLCSWSVIHSLIWGHCYALALQVFFFHVSVSSWNGDILHINRTLTLKKTAKYFSWLWFFFLFFNWSVVDLQCVAHVLLKSVNVAYLSLSIYFASIWVFVFKVGFLAVPPDKQLRIQHCRCYGVGWLSGR